MGDAFPQFSRRNCVKRKAELRVFTNRTPDKIKLHSKRGQFTGQPNFDAFSTFFLALLFSLLLFRQPGNRARSQFCAWNSTLKALLVFYRTFPAESSTFGHLLGPRPILTAERAPEFTWSDGGSHHFTLPRMQGEIIFALKFVFRGLNSLLAQSVIAFTGMIWANFE